MGTFQLGGPPPQLHLLSNEWGHLMIQNTSLAVPHGILFLIDPTNVETIVPEHESGVLVASTATCIAVGTQPDTDGEIAIDIGPGPLPTEGLAKRSTKTIHAPGGTVALVTSHFQLVLEMAVPPGEAVVVIWTDDPVLPARIAIEVKEQRPA